LARAFKALSFQCLANATHAGEAGALVEGDKVDARQIADQPALQLAHDPGQFGLWPCGLQGPHERHDMGDVANGGGA
jgi:hypothetical protein